MNKKLLRSEMILHDDTNSTLANALGISPQSLSSKMNETNGAEFTQKEMHNAKTADAQEVLEYLTSVMRGEHKEQVLKLIGDGIQTISDIDVGAKDRIKAAELIGKRYGMFKDGLAVEVEPVTLVNDLTE